jgi:hypothetical protein
VQPPAPSVLASIPSLGKVIVNATATAAGTNASLEFLNDTTYFAGSSDCTTSSSQCVILNTNYHTWTWKLDAGSTPDGKTTVSASGNTSATGPASTTLTLASPVSFKIQEGMSVVDLTTSGNMPAGAYVDQTPSVNNQVHIAWATGSGGSFATDQLQFSGCGYPGLKSGGTMQPWLGNCAATAFLIAGSASGTSCDYIHAHGWRVYMHMNSGQETVCNKIIFDSGSGGTGSPDDSATADPTSVGIWIEGNGDKIELADGKVEAATDFLNLGNPATENDGASLANFNFAGSSSGVVFASASRTVINGVHGSASGIGYSDSTGLSLAVTGSVLENLSVYYDDPTLVSQNTFCANNFFASSFCSSLLQHVAFGGSAPSVAGGGASATVAGNDGAGRITLGSSPTNAITLSFSAAWANAPVCFAQDETTPAKNPGTATATDVNSVTFAFVSTPAGSDKISYQCIGVR